MVGFLTKLALRPVKTVTDLVKKRKAQNSEKATASTQDAPVSAPAVPAAAPGPIHTHTTFNQDGTVNYTDKTGKPFHFTKAEYNAFLAGQGSDTAAQKQQLEGFGGPTPQVQQALNPDARVQAEQRAQAEQLIPQINQVPEEAIQTAQAAQDANSVGATSLLTNAQAIGSGAATGAALGSPGGPVGATIGAVVGAGGAVITKISISKKQSVKEANNNFKLARGNMDAIITRVNQGTLAPAEAVKLWNEQLATIRVAERLLKRETDSNLDRFVSGGADELATLRDFQKYELQFWSQDLANAIANPDPSKIRAPLSSDQEKADGQT